MKRNEIMGIVENCRMELKDIGIETPEVTIESMSSTTVWGKCIVKRNGRMNSYIIKLNKKLYDGTCESDIPLRNTIIHELLHTVVPYAKHGKDWKILAERVNRKYSIYDVKRLNSYTYYGLTLGKEAKRTDYYIAKCEKCGQEIKRRRFSKIIANLSNYRCGICKGNLKLIQTPDGVQILKTNWK